MIVAFVWSPVHSDPPPSAGAMMMPSASELTATTMRLNTKLGRPDMALWVEVSVGQESDGGRRDRFSGYRCCNRMNPKASPTGGRMRISAVTPKKTAAAPPAMA
jgi:hypothetical protein